MRKTYPRVTTHKHATCRCTGQAQAVTVMSPLQFNQTFHLRRERARACAVISGIAAAGCSSQEPRPLPHPPLLTVIAGATLSTPSLLDTGKQVLGLVFWFGL